MRATQSSEFVAFFKSSRKHRPFLNGTLGTAFKLKDEVPVLVLDDLWGVFRGVENSIRIRIHLLPGPQVIHGSVFLVANLRAN